MDDWKERLKAEYKELKERLDKLHKWNVKEVAICPVCFRKNT